MTIDMLFCNVFELVVRSQTQFVYTYGIVSLIYIIYLLSLMWL